MNWRGVFYKGCEVPYELSYFSPVFQWQLLKLITIVFDIYYSTVNNPRYELNCHSKIDNKNDKIKANQI